MHCQGKAGRQGRQKRQEGGDVWKQRYYMLVDRRVRKGQDIRAHLADMKAYW
jgi:hypothetical protein